MQKPKVEHIEGLSPAIAIEQRTAGGTPRSTVATVTEIYDYLRLLYAHIGVPHCPHCGRKLQSQSAQAIAEQLLALKPGQKMMILAPFVNGRKGEHRDVLDSIRSGRNQRKYVSSHWRPNLTLDPTKLLPSATMLTIRVRHGHGLVASIWRQV